MAGKPNSRNWNDVQTAIATVAIVTTLGLWNLFATPSKTKAAQNIQPVIPPTQPPVQSAPSDTTSAATAMPQVKIMFAQLTPTPQVSIVQQIQNTINKKKNRNNGGGGGTVTQTKTS